MSDPIRPIPEIESPCIGTCTLGPDDLCVGCFRSATEITGWLGYTPEQRREIMQALPARADRLFDGD
jgi:predicted Fe-S protein YdhL (DUF1289 family)